MDTVVWVKLQAIIRALRRSEEPKKVGFMGRAHALVFHNRDYNVATSLAQLVSARGLNTGPKVLINVPNFIKGISK